MRGTSDRVIEQKLAAGSVPSSGARRAERSDGAVKGHADRQLLTPGPLTQPGDVLARARDILGRFENFDLESRGANGFMDRVLQHRHPFGLYAISDAAVDDPVDVGHQVTVGGRSSKPMVSICLPAHAARVFGSIEKRSVLDEHVHRLVVRNGSHQQRDIDLRLEVVEDSGAEAPSPRTPPRQREDHQQGPAALTVADLGAPPRLSPGLRTGSVRRACAFTKRRQMKDQSEACILGPGRMGRAGQ